ncbi:intermembrane transport protein PqiB [Pollutimonas harenae]|uniref:PqiB family protein n=1 Tax=Pollutimonas harenae TaxID=657015 RepID=UPI001021530F|nr:MlaD family protein [Pollutimonas harenae]TEA71342.1 MCE family protein [Pollutimonas harenae]
MTDPNKPQESSQPTGGPAGSGAAVQPYTPEVKSRSQSRISWIWLLPLVAALVGGSLLVRGWLHMGPTINISFESADGLEVGQTKVRYKDVVIGVVSGIKVAPDRSKVIVSAELNRDGSEYITQSDSRFWVVRPRLGISGVSGLGTLLSGAYISVDAAETSNGAEPVYDFEGLEKPPEVVSGRPGSRFTLFAPDLGSLEIGSPVYYRRIEVGRVIGYDLDSNGEQVNIQVFIDAPNDKFVTKNARFWNVSGINLSLNADGFNVETGSLVSVLAGGVAFASSDHSLTEESESAKPDSRFELSPTYAQAMADPDGPAFPIELHFYQSVRGLKVGAPVDFRGLELGEVYDIDLEFNAESKRFFALVRIRLYPMRFGEVYERLIKLNPGTTGYPGAALLGPMIQHGLRGQIRASNLLTGQQYVALDFFPDAEPVAFDDKKRPAIIPTIAGSFDRLQQQISSIVGKLDAIPFDKIGTELQGSLESARKLLDRLETQVAPEASGVLKSARNSLNQLNKLLADNSPMNNNIERTMRELSNAAKSLRALADYLQTHPTALIRGREESFPVTP